MDCVGGRQAEYASAEEDVSADSDAHTQCRASSLNVSADSDAHTQCRASSLSFCHAQWNS
jgi:hypothetical protein